MITPIELHNKQFKSGRGYNKKEMDIFLDEVFNNYEILYKENAELKEKITQLSDGIQYYKAMETTLQKALVLAEKTSKDTIESANSKAALIEKEAHINADKIINNAQLKSEEIKNECISLLQQYKQFKAQFKQIAQKQIELLDGNFYEIYSKDLIDAINDVSYQTAEITSETTSETTVETTTETVMEKAEKSVRNTVNKPTAAENNEIVKDTVNEIVSKTSTELEPTVPKGDTKEFAPIEIEIITKNIENIKEDVITTDSIKEDNNASVYNENNISKENNKEDNDPFNKIIRELKEDLAQELANSNTVSSFEFIDND